MQKKTNDELHLLPKKELTTWTARPSSERLFSDKAFNLSSIIKMKTNIKRWINVTWESMDIHEDVFYPQNSSELA